MSNQSNSNQSQKATNPHDYVHEFHFDILEDFYEFPYSPWCNEVCIKEYKESMDKIIKTLEAIAFINTSVKVKEDGTIPWFSIFEVLNYYGGYHHLVDNKKIQDLFKINLLDLNFPDFRNRTKETQSSEENPSDIK